jgi:glycine/D-amino acid oxidase-like deaminating enzyme
MAPRISQIPVNVTMNSGFGTNGGTMATMSARMLLKWAAAVKQNITARPIRVDAAQSLA